MTGGRVHELMLDLLEKAIQRPNVVVSRQVPARPRKGISYIDLVAEFGGKRLAIEVEMTSRRAVNDLHKAAAVGATWLWIVGPNRRVTKSVSERLRKLGVDEKRPWLRFLTFGEAVQHVGELFRDFPVS